MYYEERVIQSVLNFRTAPDGEWEPMSKAQLTRRIEELEAEIADLRHYKDVM